MPDTAATPKTPLTFGDNPPSRLKNAARLATILYWCMRYRLDALLHPYLSNWMRLALLMAPTWLFSTRKSPGERLRFSMERLGPIFIKFGQAISTRRDLLSEDVAQELAKLQEHVTPFPAQEFFNICEAALGMPLDQVFAEIEPEALASASLAQVHAAKLKNGDKVVIKVLRPGIENTVRRDLALLRLAAKAINRLPNLKLLRLPEAIEEYSCALIDELNLLVEAANTAQLKRNFPGAHPLYVPHVYWDWARRNMLVMERIYGVPVDRIDELRAAGCNLKKLAERGVEICFSQIFRDNFFHADMHPGNVYVSLEKPDDPAYIALDCAVVGSLAESELYYLGRNLQAIFERDYRLAAELHVRSGWVPKNTRITDFERALRTVCEPIFARPLGEISFGSLLVSLFATARRFRMQLQPSLVLLQKTLLQIEGLGRQLYPELDLWNTAYPGLKRWMRARYHPGKVAVKELKKNVPLLITELPGLPERALKALETWEAQQQRQEEEACSTERQPSDRSLKCFILALVLVNIALITLLALDKFG